MEDRDRFNNLPNLRTDNEIIDAVLSGLAHCRERTCQPFILHRFSMKPKKVNHIVYFMESENLIEIKKVEFDKDEYEYNLKLTNKGSLIANDGGWLAYLERNMTESDWIDKVLADAGNHSVVLPRSTPDEYRKAVHDAISKGFIDPNSYYLLPKGQEVVDAKGFDKWKEPSEAKTESEWIDQILDEALTSIAGMSKDSHPGYISALKKCIGLDLLTNSLTNPKLKESGYKVIELHGIDNWLVYNNKQKDTKSNSIIIHGPVTKSVLTQDSLSGNVANHDLINHENAEAASAPKKADQNTPSLSIGDKIYKWTDHKTISALIVAAIAAIVSWLIHRFG